MKKINKSTHKKIIYFFIIIVVIALAYLFYEETLTVHPQNPQPSTGQIVSHEIKGVTVYISQSEKYLIEASKLGLVGSLLLIALSIAIWGNPTKKELLD
jgi:hypothetical protein